MPIDNATWHARVGIFYAAKLLHKSKPKSENANVLYSLLFFWYILVTIYRNTMSNVFGNNLIKIKYFLSLRIKLPKKAKVIIFSFLCILNLLFQCGDIEKNPGPKYSSLKFCHWNLNGLRAHNSVKKSLLQAYLIQHNYDIVCISETFLNSTIQDDDESIKIDGYTLIRSDHPSDSKRGGVCIYYKEHIPLIKRDDLRTLDNCLVTEIRSQNEKCFLTCIYRSPSQSPDEFENFCLKFDLLLNKVNDEFPLCSIITGDFNARCSRWWKNDITNVKGEEIDTLTSSAGYSQIIDKPTHILNNSKSCIDLIFCTNKNIISNYGVDVSIFEKCHHNIIFGKINISVPLPPVYVREVWDYSKANVEHINKAISNFNWHNAFKDLSVDEKVKLLNETLLNIFRNYIPNKKIKCDYREPPWMTDKIKTLLKYRNKLTKMFYKNGQKTEDHEKVLQISAECTNEILEAKNTYILKMSKKLEDPKSAPKTYWTILNRLIYNKKIPTIPPLFVNGNFVSDFSVKANLFNEFYASICTPIKNSSVLPPLRYRTNKKLSYFSVSEKDILLIIKALDSSKAHGYDNLSIKMIKLCEKSITIPLKLIFEESLKCGVFPEIWKKANVVPVHKKEDKTLVKNYRPISLLPIFGKIFERVIYNSIFNYFNGNKLFTPSQSGFLPGDSCIAQLLSIIHEIQTAFDENPAGDVRGIFLDISKAFDKVWHEGLLYKLKTYGIDGQLLSLLENYLKNREQRVVLNGQTSEWRKIKSGVPQGSVLGPLLFLIYINDLPDGISSICKIFADDTSLFSKVIDINESANNLNSDLEKITKWAHQWKMQFNPDPNKQANEVIFSKKLNGISYPPVKFNNNDIAKCSDQKHLGIVLDSMLNFESHVNQKIKKCNKLIGVIRRLSVHLPRTALLTIYKSFIRPNLDYGDILYDKPKNENFQNKLEKVQYRACLAITNAIQGTSKDRLYDELGLYSLTNRRWKSKLIFFYKIVNGMLPNYLYSFLDFPSQENYPLRSASENIIRPIPTRTKTFKNSFFPFCISEWNNLATEIRNAKSINIFKKLILKEKKEHSLFSIYDPLGVKLLTRLRLQFSHLNEHKFRHGFNDTLNPICACGNEIETTEHFFLRCHFFSAQRKELFKSLEKMDPHFLELNPKKQVLVLLYGSQINDSKSFNHDILKNVITFIKATARFDRPLINESP